MKSIRPYILSFACIISAQFTIAQNDLGAWFAAEVETKLTDQFSVGLETQLRLDDNASHINNRFISPSIKWKAHKHISIGTAYRLSSVLFNSSTTNRTFVHRYTLDIVFGKLMDLINKKSKLGISMRLRGTTQLEAQKLNENNLRYKLKFDYNIPKSKLQPYIAGELFYRFNNQLTYTATEVIATNSINKIRLKIGATYKLKKRHTLKFFSLMQKQLLSQESEFILGVGYSYKLKIK